MFVIVVFAVRDHVEDAVRIMSEKNKKKKRKNYHILRNYLTTEYNYIGLVFVCYVRTTGRNELECMAYRIISYHRQGQRKKVQLLSERLLIQ